MDLNRLRPFYAVFKARSVARAAQSLHVTPSAVSQALRLLEEELGVHLFQRQPRALVPTPQAEDLARIYVNFSGQLEGCVSSWRESAKEPQGTLRIGAPPEFGARQVVSAISRFSRNRRARFTIEFGSPEPILARLVVGDLDLAFCDSLPVLRRFKSAVVTETVFFEKSVLVCSPEFFEAEIGDDQSYGHLIKVDHIDYLENAGIMQLWYQHHFRKSPGNLSLRLVAHDVQAMIAGALSGLGVAFVPEHLVRDHLRRRELVVINGPGKPGKNDYINPIVLVRLKDHVPTLLERRFIERMRGP